MAENSLAQTKAQLAQAKAQLTTAQPVSYAHLDVYKRQSIHYDLDDTPDIQKKGEEQPRQPRVVFNGTIDQEEFLDRVHKFTGISPVSYTHLDVYKRQP